MATLPLCAKAVFDEAAEFASLDERHDFLDRACVGAPDLRRQVEALLAAYEKAGSFLEQPAFECAPTIDQPPQAAEGPGTMIGPYKLLQQIGEGGMGTVYSAEQREPVQRKVAVKVIKAGMDSRPVIIRFDVERQALAMMDHVNIARVLDAGATESGRPFFAMELVHGVPITKYCDDNHLTLRERLELFVPVCQAIQHAHQKGIIHRDIKPSNVMITLYDGKPVPKVIDFGVAKAIEQKLTERTLFTHYGAMVGTLEYMSPEQAEMSALRVDTRSDIYSLGVLLYELLTGSTPLSHKRMNEAAYGEILHMIKEEEAPKPSTRLSDSGEALASISAQRKTEPAKLSKLVRGELDWIVMKCLEKDRNRRYETASGFAADVQRYLNDETVQACPPSAGYRLRKFARRNKVGLVIAALLAAALIAVMAALAIGNVRIAREQGRTKAAYEVEAKQRRRAQDSFGKALGGIERMFTDINQELLPTDPARRKLLESVLALCQDLIKDDSADESARQGRGSAYLMRAQIHGILRQPVPAEEAYRQALDVFGGLAADFPDQPSYRHNLALTHSLLGLFLRLAATRLQEAEELDRRAIDMLDGMAREFPDNTVYQKDLARCYHELGYLLWSRGRTAQAETAYRQALAVQEVLAPRFGPPASEDVTNQANTLNSLGILLRIDQRLGEAELVFRQALDALNKLPADQQAAAPVWQQLARSLGHLGIVLGQTGRFVEAEQLLRQAVRLRGKTAAGVHNTPEASQELALSYRHLGWLLAASGQTQEAEKAYGKALALMEKVLDALPAQANYRMQQAMAQSDLGNLHASTGENQKAKPLFHQALAGFRLACDGNPDDADCRNYLARFLATCPDAAFRDPAQAVALAAKAVAQAPKDGAYWNTLGIAQYRAGDWKAAAQALDRCMALRPANGFDWFFLAMTHWQLGHKDEAHKWYEQAVQWMEKYKRQDEELRRFRVEAAALLKLAEPSKKETIRFPMKDDRTVPSKK
jgi:eukaryotic-like serine/threonine-protein kinase